MTRGPRRGRRQRPSGTADQAYDGVPRVLADTARAIWPAATRLTITRGIVPPRGAVDYVVLPSVSSPRWLLPARARSTTAALIGQEASGLRRAAVRLLALAHGSGVVRRLPVRRLRVTDAGASLVTALQDVVGADARIAIRLGSWRHARSLVVRVFGPDGATTAFGKVGIDAQGRASVQDEARALARIAALDLAHIACPEVLHRGMWRDLEVLLVSPLVAPARPRADGMPVEAMLELAHAGASRTGDLRDSRWWSRVAERLDAVADPALRDDLASARTRLESAAPGVPLPLACCHGDWTPWNMARDGARILLWDWEHFADDVPFGFDHVHYLAQQLRVSAGTGADAEETWRRRAEDALAGHVGLDRDQRALVLVAYLLEVNLRFVLDRQSTPESDVRRDGWGLDLLRREARHLRTTP